MARGIGESVIDLSDQTIDDLAAAIRAGGGGSNPSDPIRTNGGGGGNTASERQERTADAVNKRFNELKEQSSQAARGLNSLSRVFQITTNQQYQASRANQKAYQAITQLEREIEELSKATDAESKAKTKELTNERNRLTNRVNADKKYDAGIRSTIGFVEKLAKNYQAAQFAVAQATVQGQNSILNAAQSGAGGFQIAAAQMASASAIQAASVNGLITQVQSASSALGALGPAGVAAAGVIGFFTQKQLNANAIAVAQQQQAQKMIVTGAENVFKGYKDAVGAGAIFAQGADTLAKSLKGSNITIKEAGELIKANASLLSESNMGVAKGAELMNKVFAGLRKGNFDKGLAAIGFGINETATAIAQVMGDMKRQDPTKKLTEEEVQKRTKEYAVNLATISSIQGKSIKQLQDEAKERQGSLMFRQFMNSLGPKAAQVNAAFDTIPPQFRKAVGQIADPRLGTIIDKNVAAQAAMVPALGNMLTELGMAARNGVLTPEMAATIQAKYKDSIQGAILNMDNYAMAISAELGKGKVGELAKPLLEGTDWIVKWGGSANNAATSAAEVAEAWKIVRGSMENIAAGKGVDGGAPDLTATILSIEQKGRDITKSIDDAIVKNMPKIGAMIIKALEDAKKMIDGYLASDMLNNANGGAKGMDWKEMIPYIVGAVVAVLAAGGLMKLGGAGMDKILEKMKGGPKPPTGGSPPRVEPHMEPHGPGNAAPHEPAPSRTTTATPHGGEPPRPGSMEGWKQGQTAGANPNVPTPGGSKEAQAYQREAAAAREAAEKSAKAATEASVKETEKVVAKQAGKAGLKKIPFLAWIFGLGFAAQDVMAGDYVGAGANVASGIAGSIPVVGTAASLAIDAGDTIRRVNNASNEGGGGAAPTAGPNGEKLIRMPNGTLGYQKASRNGPQFVPLVNGKFGDSMDYSKAFVANGGAMPTSATTASPTSATTASQKVATNGMPTINLSSDSIASMATAFQNAFKDSVIKNAVASVPTKANAAVSSKTINMDELNKLGKSDPTLFALSSLIKQSDDQKKIVEKTQVDSKKQMEELIQAIELMAEKAGVSAKEIQKLRRISQ